MSPLMLRLIERARLPVVDDLCLDDFLVGASKARVQVLLFFSGDGQNRLETGDVAVVLPELLSHFFPRLRGAVIAPDAEEGLRARLHAYVSPSLVVMRGREPVGVLPKIWDWADYIAKIEGFLDPSAPALAGPKRPQVEISFSGGA
ncbi:MAG: hydrogenase accessory protein [Methylocystis sp.]|uniref:hydrogenase accessory protein n=1 Tax=Methylocystis sp. TaxID=1911079 RepID=UPI003D0B85E1